MLWTVCLPTTIRHEHQQHSFPLFLREILKETSGKSLKFWTAFKIMSFLFNSVAAFKGTDPQNMHYSTFLTPYQLHSTRINTASASFWISRKHLTQSYCWCSCLPTTIRHEHQQHSFPLFLREILKETSGKSLKFWTAFKIMSFLFNSVAAFKGTDPLNMHYSTFLTPYQLHSTRINTASASFWISRKHLTQSHMIYYL